MTPATDAVLLGELRDRRDIQDALMRYCRGVDRADPELIASAVHPDAVIDTGAGTVTGTEAPQRFGQGMAARGITSVSHFIGNQLIELEGDTAFSEAYLLSYMTVTKDGREHTRVRGGRYIDRFERRDGVWKVARRVVADDWSRVDPVGSEAEGIGTGGPFQGRQSKADPVYLMRAGRL